MSQDRKELLREYKQSHRPAGVYRIVSPAAGRYLLESTTNLPGAKNRFEFAKSTRSAAGVSHKLSADFLQYDDFVFEVLEELETKPEMTPAQVAEDVKALEQLWREKLGGVGEY